MDKELENSLRSYDAGPGEHAKRTVMSEYSAEFRDIGEKKFWYKSIPLYKAVAAAILIAMLSAFTGGYLVSALHEKQSAPVYVESNEAVASAQFRPAIAESDAF